MFDLYRLYSGQTNIFWEIIRKIFPLFFVSITMPPAREVDSSEGDQSREGVTQGEVEKSTHYSSYSYVKTRGDISMKARPLYPFVVFCIMTHIKPLVCM